MVAYHSTNSLGWKAASLGNRVNNDCWISALRLARNFNTWKEICENRSKSVLVKSSSVRHRLRHANVYLSAHNYCTLIYQVLYIKYDPICLYAQLFQQTSLSMDKCRDSTDKSEYSKNKIIFILEICNTVLRLSGHTALKERYCRWKGLWCKPLSTEYFQI